MEQQTVFSAFKRAGLAIHPVSRIGLQEHDPTMFCAVCGNLVADIYCNPRGDDGKPGRVNFICVRRVTEHNDSRTDYFPGWNHHTIKGALRDLMTARRPTGQGETPL